MRATLNKRERMHKRIAARYCLKGLPRMRGDRPGYPTEMGHDPKATPHARGSTLALGHTTYPHHGYPACAGIDHS